MLDEPLADIAAATVDNVEDAVRQPRLREELDVALAEGRRVGRGLEDDRVAADDRGQRLPGGGRDREVPGSDRTDDADRHPHGHLELVPELGGGRLAEQAG